MDFIVVQYAAASSGLQRTHFLWRGRGILKLNPHRKLGHRTRRTSAGYRLPSWCLFLKYR
jgi:hypothetical protein